jgi:hypothetical protein
MHFGVGNIEESYEMAYDQGIVVTLDDTTEEQDQAVWITNDLKSASPVAHAVSTANKLLGLIRRCFSYLDCQLVRQLVRLPLGMETGDLSVRRMTFRRIGSPCLNPPSRGIRVYSPTVR